MTFIDQVMTDRITAEARQIRFWRTVLTVIAGLLFGLGWLTCKVLRGLWLVVAWCSAAVKVGFQEARK